MKFDQFIDQYGVRIPVVQRDYVQGSEQNKGKRDPFVKNILESLSANKPMLLHFIYGAKHTATDGTEEYLPFDGQQRLTTLTLIGWLLLRYAPDEATKASWQKQLTMTYETRNSSREFVNKLLTSQVPDSAPSKFVKEQIWFAESWELDPSVKAMLEMLDYVKEQLAGYTNLADMAKIFFSNSPLEFEETTLNLTTRKQMDDLYIKINARGKFLTEFENWKAHFIGLLQREHGQEVAEEFETKIDGDWCDFFWEFCDKNEAAPRIDEHFMNFYNYVTQLLHGDEFTSHKEYERLALTDEIYKKEENVRLLFAALDTIPTLTDAFFENHLFGSTDPKDPAIGNETRVNLFYDGNVNILDTIINNRKKDLRLELLLWGIIRYEHKYQGQARDTLQFIRLWWGYLMHRRQRLANGFKVDADLAYKDLTGKNIMGDLEKLLDKADTMEAAKALAGVGAVKDWYAYNHAGAVSKEHYEKDIIPLQNHPWLLYDVHILDTLIMDSFAPGDVYHLFMTNFVQLRNRDRVTKLLENGFHGLKIDRWREKYTYGLTGNWPYILTASSQSLQQALTDLLRNVNGGLSENHRWLNEFVRKYVDLLNCDRFAGFDIAGQYELFSLTDKRQTRRGYLTDPYNYVVVADEHRVQDWHNSVEVGGVNISFYTLDSRHFGICLHTPNEGVQMKICPDGWEILEYDANVPLPAKVAAEYRVGEIVPIDGGNDHITQGRQLLKKLVSLI